MMEKTSTQDLGSVPIADELKHTEKLLASSVNLQEEYGKALGKRQAEDWDKEMAKELGVSRDVTKDAAAPTEAGKTQEDATPPTWSATPAYFTEGEMLPWKGRWFRVKLLQLPDGQKVIGLVQVKATASSTKRAERELRWQRNHPHATAPRPGSQLPFTPRASSQASA